MIKTIVSSVWTRDIGPAKESTPGGRGFGLSASIVMYPSVLYYQAGLLSCLKTAAHDTQLPRNLI